LHILNAKRRLAIINIKPYTMKKVTGLGGVFFKSQNPKAMNDWYAKNLGLPTSDYGTRFEWREAEDSSKKGSTSWCAFPQDTPYFNPSDKPFMINYRVENLNDLLVELRKEGVTIVDEVAEYSYGKFVHIMDPEGNMIELWEPVDEKEGDA
jgi:predicted enzyme related to lactoylglutathione lyase